MLNWLFCSPGYYYPTYAATPIPRPTEPDRQLDARLHSLELACAALWEILKQKNGYTDDELSAMIKQVDQRRGAAANPALGANIPECPRCHHKMLTANHNKCLWCGADLATPPISQP